MAARVFSCAIIGPDLMRQPMADKVVTISQAQGTLTFPANFTLVAAMNL